jgi:aminomethyltransferase
MKPGEQLYAFFLTAQGRIVSDVWITCYEDHLLLDVEPGMRETVWKHIDHYIIADDVLLEDVTSSTFGLIAAGKRIYGGLADKQRTIAALGLTEASPDDARAFRIEKFHPQFGEDFTTANLAQETGLNYALHFSKGCYLGQEIVERVRSRGHVNKMLVGLALRVGTLAPAGTKVHLNGEEIGEVTSWWNLAAIAMLRVQGTKPGTIVQVGGVNAEVTAVS